MVGLISSVRSIIKGQYLQHICKRCSSIDVKVDENLKKNASRKKLIYVRGQRFVDWLEVRLKAGKGGNGCVHFVSSRSNTGGPDGGDGGSGGSIHMVANRNIRQLSHLKRQYVAVDGTAGSKGRSQGKSGADITLQVPTGSQVKDSETGSIIVDLLKHGDQLTVARGGIGGMGNVAFKRPTHQAPEESCPGEPGEEKLVQVELKSIADVGLVGFPNAGKSTLLRALSRAKPQVAAYPFTTLKPHIGMMEFKDTLQIAIADIPGLVENAHLNKGLGHSFLRHIERCKSLLYVIDGSSKDLTQRLDILQNELELYQEGLSRLPSAIVVNKIDIFQTRMENVVRELENRTGLQVFAVSGKFQLNTSNLKYGIRTILEHSQLI